MIWRIYFLKGEIYVTRRMGFLMVSELFFNYPTCIDHAFIDNNGRVIGGSYHPIITVQGKVDYEENVVIDFSEGKKLLKEVIDDPSENGYDHKLWFIENYSAGVLKNYSDTHWEIQTIIGTVIRIPKVDVKVIKFNPELKDEISLMKIVENDIEETFKKHGYFCEFDVKVKLTQILFSTSDKVNTFRYTHGLKDSTSEGCKNIAHGHLSFFEITKFNEYYRDDCSDCKLGLKLIEDGIKNIDGVVFVYKDNIIERDTNKLTLSYDTPRGAMYMSLNPNLQPVIETYTETTIENLGVYLRSTLMNALYLAKVSEFRISEGLQKGVVMKVPSLDDNVLI